jgi:hypothetical protein
VIGIETWPRSQPTKRHLFDARKIPAPSLARCAARSSAKSPRSARRDAVFGAGRVVEVSRVRFDDGANILASEAGIPAGIVLGAKPPAVPNADRDKAPGTGGPPPPS